MLTSFSIVASLFLLEILLSVDNALVNAAIAESLPEEDRKRAIRYGIILGACFRVVSLFFASLIISSPWIRICGALYLMYLAVKHLRDDIAEETHHVVTKDSYGAIIRSIVLADIVFSIDNVVSAVSFSSSLFYVITGVLIGAFSMLFITPIISHVIRRYRGLKEAAYVIVGLIGTSLLIETLTHHHLREVFKFGIIISIILFTLSYEKNEKLQRFFSPLLHGHRVLFGKIHRILNANFRE